ncbi:hypothetical protein HYS48_03515, partial [Candidatus Woesearchaeota archaeon]|nr:hypothetical protein [Candidatus Woesearchaeota archaeon]
MVMLFLILLLFFPISITALQEDFHAFPESKTLAVCSCGLREGNIIVENTGEVPSSYRIAKEGMAAPWASYTEQSFTLQPGETKVVRQFVHVPCNSEGTYDLITKIETAFDVEKEVVQEVDVDACINLNIAPLSEFRKTNCPCVPEVFEFEIQNTQNFPDSFEVFVEPDGAATVSEPLLFLGPGEKKLASVFINYPCEIFGEKAFEIVAVSQSNKIEGRHPFWLNIGACYAYTIQMQDNYEACRYVLNTIPVTIKNTADIANFYDLTLKGPRWGSLEHEELFLFPGERLPTNILLDPADAMPGEYVFTLQAETEKGALEQERAFTVMLNNCFDLSLVPETETLTIVSCEPNKVGMQITNVGTKETRFGVNLEGPDFISLDANTFSLKSGESRMVNQVIRPPCSLVEDFATGFTAGIVDVPYIAQERITNFRTVPLSQASALDIETEERYTVRYVPTENYVTFTNKGIRDGQYLVQVLGQNWMFLNETAMFLQPGESKVLSLITQPTADVVEGIYPIAIQAGLVNPYGQDVQYVKELEVKLRAKTLFQILLPWILIVVLLGVLGLVTYYFLVLAPKARPKRVAKPIKEKKAKPRAGEKFVALEFTPR